MMNFTVCHIDSKTESPKEGPEIVVKYSQNMIKLIVIRTYVGTSMGLCTTG